MGRAEEIVVSPMEELNQICPYFTMFPLTFPLGALKRARPGDTVIDPFCGRGTTLTAGRALGLRSVGIDASPVAAAIAQTKIVRTTPKKVVQACERILNDSPQPQEIPDGKFWQWAYSNETLTDLCRLREALRNPKSDSRIALRTILLGALHGPLRSEKPWYLSNQMPRVFSSKPGYSGRFLEERGVEPPVVDVLDLVSRRAEKYLADCNNSVSGKVIQGDSRTVHLKPHVSKAKWVVTSPPYYGMNTYRPDQWLREWFLGGPASVTYSDQSQLSHSSPDEFAHQLSLVWMNLARVCRKNARMHIRFGGINDRKGDPREIIESSIEQAALVGWKLVRSTDAGEPLPERRLANHFQSGSSPYVEERDYVVKLR